MLDSSMLSADMDLRGAFALTGFSALSSADMDLRGAFTLTLAVAVVVAVCLLVSPRCVSTWA